MTRMRYVKMDRIMNHMLIHALREVFRQEKEQGLPVDTTRDLVLKLAEQEDIQGNFHEKRILVIHSGGDSKRVPQYSVCGKLFSPVPRELPDGRGSTLFDAWYPAFHQMGSAVGCRTETSQLRSGRWQLRLRCGSDRDILPDRLPDHRPAQACSSERWRQRLSIALEFRQEALQRPRRP